MHRCGSGFLLTLAIISATALTGCLGKNSGNPGNGGVSSVTLNPATSFSMDVGSSQVFSATAKNATGGTILGVDIQFVVTSGTPTDPSTAPPPLSVASNGNGCAGTWDATIALCNPGTSGAATVYAVTNGIFSAPTIVYVHQHVDSIQIAQAETKPPLYPCFSQGQTWLFQATAYSHSIDVTDTVGPLTWSSSNSGVLTATPYVPPNQLNVLNQATVAAKAPGITQLFATVSGTISSPYEYTTCLVQAIYLQIGGQSRAGDSITVNTGSSVSITATAVDTLYPFTGVPMPNPPLTWSTTNPEVAGFGTLTNTTGANSATARANSGGATLTASCTPPSCNIGLPGLTPSGVIVPSLPIYASDGLLPNKTQGYGAISLDVVPATNVPTYTAWAATTGCHDASGCSSELFPVTPGLNPIGTILNLPRTPNSLVFNHQSSPRLYIGSNEGLMFVDVGGTGSTSVSVVSNSSTPCNVSLCGTVLAVSNDGKLAVVSDAVSTPNQVYIYNGGSASTPPVDLVIPGETASAAAFSPDQLKLFILTSAGNLYVYSTLDAVSKLSLAAAATDVKFSADGSFAYVAGTPASSVSAYSTCSQPGVASVPIGSVPTPATPLKLFPSPVISPLQPGSDWITQNILALEPPPAGSTDPSTSIQTLTAQFTQDPILCQDPLQFTCNPPVAPAGTPFFTAGVPVNLGQGNFTPFYSQLVADGTELIMVAQNISAVLIFDVSNKTTRSIQLQKIADQPVPLWADASADGSQVYVAACDQYAKDGITCTLGSVHIVNTCTALFCNAPPTLGQGDFQQVPFININDQNNNNMCNGLGTNAPLCVPNLIAVRPQ